MRIGILGSGLMGARPGKIFARAGTPAEAARNSDAILRASHWSRLDDALRLAGDLTGKIILRCSLPMNADDTGLVIGHTSPGAEDLAKRLPKAKIVHAYCGDENSSKQLAATLISNAGFDPVNAGPLRTGRLAYSGEDGGKLACQFGHK